MTFQAEIIELDTISCHPQAEILKQAIIEKYGVKKKQKRIPHYEWQSLSLLLQKTSPEDKILEIIYDHSAVGNLLTKFKNFVNRTKSPRKMNTRLRTTAHTKVTATQFMHRQEDCDVIISIQALEHLSEKKLLLLLDKMRVTARKKLLLLVPYMQGIPLPAEHKQQFSENKMAKIFPNATFSILLKNPVTRGPWLMIEENL